MIFGLIGLYFSSHSFFGWDFCFYMGFLEVAILSIRFAVLTVQQPVRHCVPSLADSFFRRFKVKTKGNTAQRLPDGFVRNLLAYLTAILPKSSLKYISIPASLLSNLPKNLTAHLAPNLCAVLPKDPDLDTLCMKIRILFCLPFTT